jgi:hypothetical protein
MRACRTFACQRIQVDEVWQFVGCKQKNVSAKKIERDGICGDVWTWVAIDADTKLIPSWMIGQRDLNSPAEKPTTMACYGAISDAVPHRACPLRIMCIAS